MVAGCDPFSANELLTLNLFQSSPGVVAGCDVAVPRPVVRLGRVSILTRRGGRVRRTKIVQLDFAGTVFQSSPGVVAGCDTGG